MVGAPLTQRKKLIDPGSLGPAAEDWLRAHGWVLKPRITAKKAADLAACFACFDADGSGEVDADEVMGAMKMLGLPCHRHEVEEILSLYDNDGSGCLELDEFILMMVTHMQNHKSEAEAAGPKVDMQSFSQALQRRDLLAKIMSNDHNTINRLASMHTPDHAGLGKSALAKRRSFKVPPRRASPLPTQRVELAQSDRRHRLASQMGYVQAGGSNTGRDTSAEQLPFDANQHNPYTSTSSQHPSVRADQVHAALRKFSDRMAVERGATSCRSPPVVLGNVQPYNQTTAGAPSQSKLPPYARDQRRVSALPSHDPVSNPFPWIATPRREGSYELSRHGLPSNYTVLGKQSFEVRQRRRKALPVTQSFIDLNHHGALAPLKQVLGSMSERKHASQPGVHGESASSAIPQQNLPKLFGRNHTRLSSFVSHQVGTPRGSCELEEHCAQQYETAGGQPIDQIQGDLAKDE
eukprot:CAMPEP_0114245062 /NCGR_PEP_ID=MMETSP0058-20121206/11682_1 /TAXON_ID=36894 /ORGANISM="Pyramimonas parkeae, CCMP726" /LENGTH=463 /DNA_ID=CAMNT_0001358063 /DNA_START=731 /DNA_END=2121 /DNA_ORIENTATION=+